MKTYAAILFLAVPVLGVNAASVRTSESLEARTARRVQETPPTLPASHREFLLRANGGVLVGLVVCGVMMSIVATASDLMQVCHRA